MFSPLNHDNAVRVHSAFFHAWKHSALIKKKKWYYLHITKQNIACGHSLEPPSMSGSNEYPQPMSWGRNTKK